MFADTHCHLDFEQFDADRALVLERSRQQGIEYIINVGSSLDASVRSVALAQEYASVYACVGIHPHEADSVDEQQVEEIRGLLTSEKVVAVGEIGLDYFKNFSRQDNQRTLFVQLLQVAKAARLPLVLHSREAGDDTLRILKDFMPISAVLHCFSGDKKFLQECLDCGFFVSFTANITYKNAAALRELIPYVPLDRMFLETDAPYLAPEGMRGKRNEPMQVRAVAEQIALVLGRDVQDIGQITTQNAKRFFKIP